MRSLFTLILIHCFRYILSEDLNEAMQLEKFYDSTSTNNILKTTSSTRTIILIRECIRDKQDKNFSHTPLISTHECQANNTKKIMLHYFLCNVKENQCLKFNKLIPRWNDKELSVRKSYQYSSYNEMFKNHYRKLLSYSDDMDYKNSIKYTELHEKSKSQLHNTGVNDLFKKHKKDTSDHGELWDSWSDWDACSVTCGSGRQVRWRHCLGGGCIKGLKKAQLKTCELKPCPSIFKWLGIKH